MSVDSDALNDTGVVNVWAVLVATQHSKSSPKPVSAEQRLRETRQLILRARALTDAHTTCALVASAYVGEWHSLAVDIPPHNLFLESGDVRSLDGVTQVLRSIRARDRRASVVLIPADHCAAIESAWVRAAQGALKLARYQVSTVYLLHDHAVSDKRPFKPSMDFCSSTVIVGSAHSLLELCEGTRPTQVIDLMTDDMPDPIEEISLNDISIHKAPINLVHVRLVEEYELIQNGSIHRVRSTGIDLRA